MNDVQIRRGLPGDIPQTLQLVRELALFERAPQEVTNTEAMMLEDGFGPNPVFGLFVAESEGKIVGIAIHYVRYSTWKGKMLYLEDIVVTENQRGNGIGHLLFEACMDYAIEKNYEGMIWQVLDWNKDAIRFYKKYEAVLDPEWVNGKLSRSMMLDWKNKTTMK
ncbi:MAG: GNAT family N-acetyltransferase [Flavobacteriales bacterium]|nr:GNAT family N-acetyltransferase [Flavobacteriales bacterium]